MTPQRLELTGESARLDEAIAFLQCFWRSEGLPEEGAFAFELALEELFMNVAMHGTVDSARPPRVNVSLSRKGDRVELIFLDEGTAFDPLALPEPDLNADIDARKVGGLGVFLLREMMDEVDYHQEGGWNRIRAAKRVSGS